MLSPNYERPKGCGRRLAALRRRQGLERRLHEGLLKKDLYCRAVNLVKKFDPHLNCPSTGGTNGSCWVNEDDGEWKAEPIDIPADKLVQSDRLDWTQGCKFTE